MVARKDFVKVLQNKRVGKGSEARADPVRPPAQGLVYMESLRRQSRLLSKGQHQDQSPPSPTRRSNRDNIIKSSSLEAYEGELRVVARDGVDLLSDWKPRKAVKVGELEYMDICEVSHVMNLTLGDGETQRFYFLADQRGWLRDDKASARAGTRTDRSRIPGEKTLVKSSGARSQIQGEQSGR